MIRLQLRALLLAILVAAPLAAATTGTQGTVRNRDPAILVFDMDDDASSSGGYQVDPSAGQSRTVVVQIRTSDPNGHTDMSEVTVEVQKPDGSTHRATSAASKASGNGARGDYTKTFLMSHADGPGTYSIVVRGVDSAGAAVTQTFSFTYRTLVATSVPTSMTVGSSAVQPGGNTSETPTALPVTNAGNAEIAVQVSGTQLAHASLAASLPVSSVRYATSSSPSALRSGTALAASAATVSGFSVPVGEGSSRSLHFAVFPAEQAYLPPGTYSGTLTVTAVAK